MPDSQDDETLDDFWASENPIFDRKELLEIDHVPDQERIIGRESEIDQLASSIHPAIEGGSPRNTLIYGKPGTGKSLVARHVTDSATHFATTKETAMATVFVDCTQAGTETRAIVTAAQQLNEPSVTDVDIPVTGLSTDVYYRRFWEIIDQLYEVVVIVLDEIDKLQSSTILLQLSRAGESGKLSDCSLGIIAISNKISFKETLGERALSSLQDREYIFPPYDANQLREIMRNRADAFHAGVLTEDAIPLSAALAAQEHGDARKALDILRNAGEIAYDEQREEVTEDHVREARKRADIDKYEELLDSQPIQVQSIVYALTLLCDQSSATEFSTHEIHRMYTNIAELIDIKVLSARRVRERLDEQVFLDIIGSDRRVGRGYKEGMSNEYHLLEDPSVIIPLLEQNPKFNAVAETISD